MLEFTIGDRLRKARQSINLDVRPFAELIGVSHGTVSRYELDALPAEKMKPIVLRQWAMATGVDYEWLRTGNAPSGGTPGPVGRTGLEPVTDGLWADVTDIRTRQLVAA